MKIWLRNLIGLAAISAGSAALLLAIETATAQSSSYQHSRLIGTENPNLNGIWQALNTANWDIRPHAAGQSVVPEILGAIGAIPPGQGVIEGNEIPYQPWAAAKQRENFENRMTRPTSRLINETAGDPEAKCYMPGVPRATYLPHPFQIVQTQGQVFIAYEFANAARIIHMNRQPTAPAPSWMGWSIGHWEGNTLVVEVTDQTELTWFDRAGNFHSDALRVIERYTPITPNHLHYEALIEDPNVFTHPWTISMPLYRRMEPNAQLLEFKCIEFAEIFMYEHLLESSSD